VPRRTRIDAPHPPAAGESAADSGEAAALPKDSSDAGLSAADRRLLEVAEQPSGDLVAAVTGQTLEARREQLQLHVSQLAGHLRERLREVDRREAQLNARVAQLEADLRASRLWLREREHESQQRELELQKQIEELQGRAAGGKTERSTAVGGTAEGENATDTDSFERRQQELAERESQLQLRENEARDRRFEVERQASALKHAQQLWDQQRLAEEQELLRQRQHLAAEFGDQLASGQAELQAAQQLLDEHAARLQRDQTAFAADRQAWEEQKSRQKLAVEQQRLAFETEADDRRRKLDARQDWIERQKAGLEQVRSEILGLHRQSLEMRLLSEQLWSQLNGRVAPAEITQSVAHLRQKLAEQYKLEEESLESKRAELVTLGERIAQQHEELKQMKSGLRDWTAARQAEIESQAATLIERELALDAEQEKLRQAQQQWQAERRSHEQQIRDLTRQLRAVPAAA
jgi:hypothetical protein